jgi:hypothetical protein
VTEVRENEPGDRSGPAVEIFGPGLFQPIGQKGSRPSLASKVDLFFNSIARGRFHGPDRGKQESSLGKKQAGDSSFLK